MVTLIGILLALWLVRKPIATAVIDRKLAAAHVPARYRIVHLGFGRQRLVDVVVGDPAHPDLVADWIELATRVGWDGGEVTAVRAGKLRLRGALVRGQLTLGSLDRLLPQATGAGPFRLPSIDLDVEDGRMRLATPQGVIDLGLSGDGRLDGGFSGRLAASSVRLAAGGCTVSQFEAATRLSIQAGEPTISGPVRVSRIACPGAAASGVTADITATLGKNFSTWRGGARVGAATVASQDMDLASVRGAVSFHGNANDTSGAVDLTSGAAFASWAAADRLALAGQYHIGGQARFAGRVAIKNAALRPKAIARIDQLGDIATGTPVSPLVRQAARALGAAARAFDVNGDLAFGRGRVVLSRVDARAPTGASLSLSSDNGIAVGLTGDAGPIQSVARLAGGGLPTMTLRLTQSQVGNPVVGLATVDPYAAGDARVALAPIRFVARSDGSVRVETAATLSGPLVGGRIDGLSLPIAAQWSAAGDLAVEPGCVTARFERLAVSSLRLDAAALPLCPTGAALVRVAKGNVSFGARAGAFKLRGRIGSTPLTLAASDASVDWSRRAFAVGHVTARLGSPEAVTQLSVARLAGSISGAGVDGRFDGAGGRIGAVPLLLSNATGLWRLRGGALSLNGALNVADTAADPRFKPLRAEQVALRLAGGSITARAELISPAKRVHVADVLIDHDLARGAGHADLSVPRLSFSETFQPDELTRLTFGVIADVRGMISGNAHLAWKGRSGVASTGTFRTDGIDLAAAFGPVTGLSGSIRFTDLFALQSAPGQVARVATINPGVAVTDGRITYQTLPGSRVRIEKGHWPFAGGALDLEPALLDFSAPTQRRLTFTLTGVDAGQFLQQFDFKNLSASGRFDGILPMMFDAEGGRIEHGQLNVRAGGGNIAYLGDLTQKDLGLWGNLAFQALRSINYRNLSITMNGPLAGEMITEVRFAGISQGKGAKSNFLIRRLQKLPFVFNIRIRAPFRGLIDSAQSFYDPKRLIERNLPALLQQQNAAQPSPTAIQHPASEKTP